jgi:hypothetical protein
MPQIAKSITFESCWNHAEGLDRGFMDLHGSPRLSAVTAVKVRLPNKAVERTAGSHSLAAAAHRRR